MMAAAADAEAADELYLVPPDRFTAARNELSARLRKEGRRAEADEVKTLRRPSLTAWGLNQLARQQPRLIEQVLEAGGALRDAMQAAVRGDASGLRHAQGAQRQAVDAAVAAAARLLEEGGHAPSETARQRMAGTLHAAVVDASVAGRLQAGTLHEDRDAPGFGLDPLSAPAADKGPATGRKGAVKAPPSESGEELAARRGSAREAAKEAPREAPLADREERRQARARRADLEAEADRLTRRASRLQREAEEAERQAAEARAAAEQAQQDAAAARQRVTEG